MGHSGGRSGEENRETQNRAKESNIQKQRGVACDRQQCHDSGGKMRRRSGRSKEGTGQVR